MEDSHVFEMLWDPNVILKSIIYLPVLILQNKNHSWKNNWLEKTSLLFKGEK